MTIYIKSDPASGRLIDLQTEEDRVWFEEHPEHFIRIRFPNDGDRAELRILGLSSEPVDAVIVVELRKGMRFRAPCLIAPFGDMWRALYGEPYKDEDFFPDIKELFRVWQGKQHGDKFFREFKRRCKQGRGTK